MWTLTWLGLQTAHSRQLPAHLHRTCLMQLSVHSKGSLPSTKLSTPLHRNQCSIKHSIACSTKCCHMQHTGKQTLLPIRGRRSGNICRHTQKPGKAKLLCIRNSLTFIGRHIRLLHSPLKLPSILHSTASTSQDTPLDHRRVSSRPEGVPHQMPHPQGGQAQLQLWALPGARQVALRSTPQCLCLSLLLPVAQS